MPITTPLPSSHRTCRFPASGGPVDIFRRQTQEVAQRQVTVGLGLLLGLLVQLSSQRSNVHRQLPVFGLVTHRIIHRIVRSGIFIQAVHSSSYENKVYGRAPSLHGRYPASSLLRAPPTPDRGRLLVMHSQQPLNQHDPPPRVSQVPCCSVDARCLLSPRRICHVHLPVASVTVVGFTKSGRLAIPNCVTRPNRVHLRYG